MMHGEFHSRNEHNDNGDSAFATLCRFYNGLAAVASLLAMSCLSFFVVAAAIQRTSDVVVLGTNVFEALWSLMHDIYIYIKGRSTHSTRISHHENTRRIILLHERAVFTATSSSRSSLLSAVQTPKPAAFWIQLEVRSWLVSRSSDMRALDYSACLHDRTDRFCSSFRSDWVLCPGGMNGARIRIFYPEIQPNRDAGRKECRRHTVYVRFPNDDCIT